jgi:quercetin dioxygenase-like cupin family protein
MATDFVIRDWELDPFDGDQAPTHIHHAGEEGFVCLGGDLLVTIDGTRTHVPAGGYVIVYRGTPHTFATHGGAHVLAVMSPEIADLIDGLNAVLDEEQRSRLWERCHSSVVG